MVPLLQIRLLGQFNVVAGDTPVTALNTPRLQALLAYLLLNRSAPQTRQHIAFLFWPDSSEEQAQSNFRNLLMSLRRAFPEAERYISVERRSLQWRNDSPFTLDVLEFERALAAVEGAVGTLPEPSDGTEKHLARPAVSRSCVLQAVVDSYAGDLLPGCYDEWILIPREHLRDGFLRALEGLVRALEQEGEINSAILYAQRLLRHDPLQEENYRRLMRLFLANGDRLGMMSTYRQCERVLRRELQVEPSDATRDLLRRAEGLSVAGHDESRGSRAGGRRRPRSPGNLPAQTTLFIGREREVAEVSAQLRRPECRLVTLTGTAGTGKTRLAIQVASGPGDFEHGVFFVPLAAAAEPDMVDRVIAQALEVSDSPGRQLRDNLIRFLRNKQILLVLDNFEHLLPAAGLVADLLAACPRLKVLATSRAPLNLRGEHEHVVPPMAVPGRDIGAQPDEIGQYESVGLFVDRAAEVSPHFSLTRENARAVAEITRRLEGLPLAIELAATRVKTLAPEAILSRLDRRLRLLVGGRTDLPPRQRTLETAIAWSYNLLNEAEQQLFRSLAVFVGGCTLDAAEKIMAVSRPDDGRVLEDITSLLNASLLLRIDTPGGQTGAVDEPRFAMLETLREYGLGRLYESGEAADVSRRHALYFAQLAETARPKFYGAEQLTVSEQLERDHDNIRAALRWACESEEVEIATRLAGSLERFWERGGHLKEGRSWMERVLALPADDPVGQDEEQSLQCLVRSRAQVLRGLGRFQARLGEYAAAEATLLTSVSLFEAVDDEHGMADAMNSMAIAVGMNEFDRGLAIHERCLAIRREIGDKPGIVASLSGMAHIKVNQGKYGAAAALCEEGLAIQRAGGALDARAALLHALGISYKGLGRYDDARRILEECIALCREIKNKRLAAWALYAYGDLAYMQEDYEQSRALNARALESFTEQGARPGIAETQARLGRDALQAGSHLEAREHYLQALAQATEIKLKSALWQSIAGMACVAAALGRYRDAALLFASAETALTAQYSSLEDEGLTFGMDEAREALGDEAWSVAWRAGENTPWEEAAALAQGIL